MNHYKCRLSISFHALRFMTIILLMLSCFACSRNSSSQDGEQDLDRFVQFALDRYENFNGDPIGGNWPDSLVRPTIAFDSTHDEIEGARYVGSFSLSPVNAVSFQLYSVDVIGDSTQEYFLYMDECNFSMRNWFEFHFFHAADTSLQPFASTQMAAEYLEELSFQKISNEAHCDLHVEWQQNSMAYINEGIDIYQICSDTVLQLYSDETYFFDWNYYGKDTLQEWPTMLGKDESYQETSRLNVLKGAEKSGVMARLKPSVTPPNDASILQKITEKEVVRDYLGSDKLDPSQMVRLRLLGIDTAYFLYDADHHRYEPWHPETTFSPHGK